MAAYARAWSDAERMRQAGLPVLPHQTQALTRAERAIDARLPGFGRDLDAALTRIPALAEGAGTGAGEWSDARLMTLIAAGRVERAPRERLEARARETVRAWAQLERAYEEAGKKYDHLAQRESAETPGCGQQTTRTSTSPMAASTSMRPPSGNSSGYSSRRAMCRFIFCRWMRL